MRNTYRVNGNKVYIRLAAVNGKRPLPEADLIIDLRNLEKVKAFPGVWGQTVHQKTGDIYIRGYHSKDGKLTQPIFARYLAEPGKGHNTRHKDDNPLNCLECNLVNAPIGYPCVYDLPAIGPPPEKPSQQDQATEITPGKGVSWHKAKRKWEVKPYYQGKRCNLGYWPKEMLAEANEAAEYTREYGPDAYKALEKEGVQI